MKVHEGPSSIKGKECSKKFACSANAAKSGKTVSPKVREKGDLPTRNHSGRHGTPLASLP
jgi:hypothetical protein